MLTLFPGLLFLAPLGVTLIRIAAGLTFIYMAYRIMTTREEIGATKLPVVGYPSGWLIWLSMLIVLATGILLTLGMWTQAAAIAGMIISIKHWVGGKRYAAIVPLSRSSYVLLFAICLSLLISGAGAFGVDLPL